MKKKSVLDERQIPPLNVQVIPKLLTIFKPILPVSVPKIICITLSAFAACDDLHSRATDKSATRAVLLTVSVDRAQHRQEIMELRSCYLRDIQRAERDPYFQTIVFDGTNSNTCKCPLNWRAAMRDEQADGTFVAQKIQSVLIHGVALIFYPITPNVPLGMDLTVSCLIDALQYLDPRVRKVRFQYDGILFCCKKKKKHACAS